MMDCLLSGSRWGTSIFSKGFWYDGPILKTGLPRQDILVNLDDIKKRELRNKIGIEDGYKVALYAPTFRKEMTEYSIYDLDWHSLKSVLEEKFGGKWIGAIRLHPGLFAEYKNNRDCIDLSKYSDSQEVLAISDLVITDYSSVIFDFALTGKPAFIYAPDLEEYRKDRDVYFDFDKVPFPYAKNQEQLRNNIFAFDEKRYQKELRLFLYDECGMYPIGNASENVCTLIDNFINGKKDYFDHSLVANSESIKEK